MKNRSWMPGAVALLAVAVAAGCATTKSVDKKIAESQAKTDKKIESVESQVEDLQDKQKTTEGTLGEHGQKIEQVSQSAADALKRAQEAGVLAKGKVVFQQTFAEDRVRFKLNAADLTQQAKEALDEFAQKVKALDRAVYMEIQGHTDNTGSKEGNEKLGERRADAVRRYLSMQHHLPLARMSTISYGDTLPVASNKTKAGRAQNRRVVIVVLE